MSIWNFILLTLHLEATTLTPDSTQSKATTANEENSVASAFTVNFLRNKGMKLIPGYLVNLNRNSDGKLNVTTSQYCNIFTGLFDDKQQMRHNHKYTRNSLRFFTENVTSSQDIDNLVYDYSVDFYEGRTFAPYQPRATDEATGLMNTTITYSYVREIQVPEKAYKWQYQGAECARPDLQSEFQYYISAIVYGSVSSFDFRLSTDIIKERIGENLCSDEQEKLHVHLEYPRPGCIPKNSVVKNIEINCNSNCNSTELKNSCVEYEIEKDFLDRGIISVEELKQILQEQVYDISGRDPDANYWSERLNADFREYEKYTCNNLCSNDMDCVYECIEFREYDAFFYRDIVSFLISIDRIKEDHMRNIFNYFRSNIPDYEGLREEFCANKCFSECGDLTSKEKIDWELLVKRYSHFVADLISDFRLYAYPYTNTEYGLPDINLANEQPSIEQLIQKLESIAQDTDNHRPLKFFIKKIPQLIEPGRENDFGPPSPEVDGLAVDFPDEENYFYNITIDNCNEDSCTTGMVNPHQEDLLRNEVPVTTEYNWVWQNHNSKLSNVYFTRFTQELSLDAGQALGFNWNSVDITEIYVIYHEDIDGGLGNTTTNKAWRQNDPQWKCRKNNNIAGYVEGVGMNNGIQRGAYKFCSLITAKGNGIEKMQTPQFSKPFRGFIAYTTAKVSVEDMSDDLIDVNGDPIEFVNPLPPQAKNPWFSEVKINSEDVGFTVTEIHNDMPVTSFNGDADETAVVHIRRPGYINNPFLKFDSPTVLEANSVISVQVDHDKLIAFKNFEWRLLVVSTTEDYVTCPPGFRSLSSKSGYMTLGYEYNFESKWAQGCKKRVPLSNKNDKNGDRVHLEITAESNWIIVISILGRIKDEYLETTSDSLVLRSGGRQRGQKNRLARLYRSRKLRTSSTIL